MKTILIAIAAFACGALPSFPGGTGEVSRDGDAVTKARAASQSFVILSDDAKLKIAPFALQNKHVEAFGLLGGHPDSSLPGIPQGWDMGLMSRGDFGGYETTIVVTATSWAPVILLPAFLPEGHILHFIVRPHPDTGDGFPVKLLADDGILWGLDRSIGKGDEGLLFPYEKGTLIYIGDPDADDPIMTVKGWSATRVEEMND